MLRKNQAIDLSLNYERFKYAVTKKIAMPITKTIVNKERMPTQSSNRSPNTPMALSTL